MGYPVDQGRGIRLFRGEAQTAPVMSTFHQSLPFLRSLLFIVFLIFGSHQAQTVGETTPASSSKKPDVLFIAVDDLRPELSIYGSPVVTPNFERLAAQGTVFERAYVQQALCHPSRVSVLSGRRPDTTGITDFSVNLRETLPDAVTLPQMFTAHGYQTAGFGKIFHTRKEDPISWSRPVWHSPKQEYHTEFGKQVLEWIKTDYRKLTFTWDLGEGITKSKRMGGLPWEAPDVADGELVDGDNTRAALEHLHELAAARKADGTPFFLAVGFHKPHLPFVAPKRYFDLYDPEQIELAPNPFPPSGTPDFAVYNWNDLRHYYGIPKIGPMPEDKARELKHAYYACVSYVDALLGRLLDGLEAEGVAENTVILLWGDHGWQLGEHGMWDKHSNFETSTHSPLIVSVPGQKPGRTDALVEFVDIYPTLADLCGLPLDPGLEGASLRPFIEDPTRPWKPAAFSQYPRVIPGQGQGMGYSIRTDRYRFTEWIVPGREDEWQAWELYDHETDPQENENLANLPEHAATVTALRKMLHEGWRGVRIPQTNEP